MDDDDWAAKFLPIGADEEIKPGQPLTAGTSSSNLSQSATAKVKDLFKCYDINGDGLISPKELAKAFESEGWSEAECSKLFSFVDKDKDGKINLEEFAEWVMRGRTDTQDVVKQGADSVLQVNKRKEAAPYLFEYFKIQKKQYAQLMDMSPEDLMEMMMDEEGYERFQAEQKRVQEEQLKPLIEKSFRHHDTDGKGVLSKDEASVFFTHFVQEEGAFFEAMMRFHLKGTIEKTLEHSRAARKDKGATAAELERKVKGDMEKIRAEIKKSSEEYITNKQARDNAAFAVLDVDSDGTLQLPELLAVLFAEDESDVKFNSFNNALGFGNIKQAVHADET